MKKSLLIGAVLLLTQSQVFAAVSSSSVEKVKQSILSRIPEGLTLDQAVLDSGKNKTVAVQKIIKAARPSLERTSDANGITRSVIKAAEKMPHIISAMSFIEAARVEGNAKDRNFADVLKSVLNNLGPENLPNDSSNASVKALNNLLEKAGGLGDKAEPILKAIASELEAGSNVEQAMRKSVAKLKPGTDVDGFIKDLIECK